jgi:hypothetical protein
VQSGSKGLVQFYFNLLKMNYLVSKGDHGASDVSRRDAEGQRAREKGCHHLPMGFPAVGLLPLASHQANWVPTRDEGPPLHGFADSFA